ncbi:MAG: DUF1800 domain-containing protein [Bacteroidetes bacterium]|nr:DUF1800 domain-containing protein [Bacteroidota bacterium]
MPIAPVTVSLKAYKGKWGVEEAAHLARRTQFGANWADVQFYAARSFKKAIKALFEQDDSIPPPPVNTYNDDKYTDEEIAAGQTWTTAAKQSGMNIGRRKNSLRSWWIGQMLNQKRSLQEKMILFWHNHFATEMNKVDNATFSYKYHMLLRRYALGNFRDLLNAITVDPCMLRYLNGANNVKKAPDENYGRELQELFTVGKDKGSHYTEDDVKAAARVLTGYRIDNKVLANAQGVFEPNRHDTTDKQFSSFYNNTIIKGVKDKEGATEVAALIDMILQQDEVSKYICRKLYRFFVYHNIDEETEKNIIEPLAKTFRKSNYDIQPVLKQLFSSKHFFDAGNRGAVIKSPIDFCIGLCREYNISFPAADDYVTLYTMWQNIHNTANQLQQNIGDPPNVAGWPAYYQVPQYDKIWINSDTLPRRNQFTDRMVSYGFTKDKFKLAIDVVAYAQTFKNPGDPDALIEECAQRLYSIPLPDKERTYLKQGILLSGLQGQMSDHYWTDAWNKLIDANDTINKKDVTNKLRKLFQYLMNLPQYQLC